MKAPQFLQAGLDAMQQRAATYDKPEGERSMSATVEAFKAITGHAITEEQGYLFMAILKAVRSQQGNYSADSYVDGAAYFGLAGEAASRDRLKRHHATPNVLEFGDSESLSITTTNAGPMLHCPDCSAEHCPCVAR